MAVTYSNLLRLAIQGVGDNPDTWGLVLNDGVFELLEDAIAGMVTVNVTAGDATLTTVDGASDDARKMIIRTTTGNPGVARSIFVPDLTKVYLVNNRTAGGHTITIKTSAGTGVALTANRPTWVYCDGTDVLGLTDVALADAATNVTTNVGGVAIANYSRRDASNNYTAANWVTPVALGDTGSLAVNLNLGNKFTVGHITNGMTGNCTLQNPTNEVNKDGMNFEVLVRQSSGTIRTLSYGSKYKFPGGVTPTITATASRIDILTFSYDSNSDRYFGSIVQNFSP